MGRLRSHPVALVASLALAVLAVSEAAACSIPVFRYALERWPAEPYQAIVLHKGALSAEDQKLVETLRKAATADGAPANLEVQTADCDGKLDKDVEALLKQEVGAEMPRLVLLYPASLRVEEKAWSGPLGPGLAARLLDSPARRKITSRLLAGDCAVWLLVECGERAKDDAAGKLLREQLAKLETTLELPTPEALGGFGEEPPEPGAKRDLKVAFSHLRVSRADKAEQAFLDVLLSIDPEFKKEKEPMAFAIFGQGRALPALVGAGINADNVAEVCAFVVGPCSCQVKAMNPGWDLLMAADWSAAIEGRLVKEPEEPVLTGSVPAPLPKEKVASAAPVPAAPSAARAPSPLLRNVLLAIVAAVILLAAASAFVLRRREG